MDAELVKQVRELSQDKGMFDKEIGEILGRHRTTITRCREANDIPRPQLKNREDKKQVCKACGRVDYIKRKEHKRQYCQPCKEERAEALKMKKRDYMKEYDKNKKHSEGMLQNP